MIKIMKYIKLKNILSIISRELTLVLNEISEITVTNLGIEWENRVDEGKAFLSNNLKNEVTSFFGNVDIKNTVIDLGNDLYGTKINSINEILNTNIDKRDKINILGFLIEKNIEPTINEYIGV